MSERRSRGSSPRLGATARVGLAALAVVLSGLLATAGRLTPDPRGFGTHEQLGRPPCAILELTGRPCPTCGMTTSFAWFVRGGIARSWRANPAGLLAAVGCLVAVPGLLASAASGRWPGRRPAGEVLTAAAVVAAAVTVLVWLVRRSLSPI